MSQMSMFDYINGITIGSIAAEMATSLEENFVQPLTAMIVYALAAILLNHGELYRENLKKAKIDVNKFLVQCRVNGYFDVSKLETAILEGNGKISFLPKVSDRIEDVLLATCDASDQVTVFLKNSRKKSNSVLM